MAKAPVRIERQADGRHAVMDATGKMLGLHKSPWSAARQMHDYYGPGPSDQVAVAPEMPKPPAAPKPYKASDHRPGTAGEHPPVPRPSKDAPPRDTKKIPAKRIPRP